MPTYELTCRACGHAFDRFLARLLRDEDLVCPECGSTDVRKGVGGGFLSVGNPRSSAQASESCGTGHFG